MNSFATTPLYNTSDAAVARELLRGILDAGREAIVIVDSSLRISLCNQPASAAFTRAGRELSGRRLSETIRDISLHDAFSLAIQSNATTDLKIELSAPEKRVYDVHVAPVNLGGAKNAIGIFYDVSQIERLERVRQEFLSNISHELRTPLTSILAFVETLEDGAIDDKENNHRFLAVIRRNAERMHDLIADILELSMIESGNVSVEIAKVNLGSMVGDIFANISSQAEARNIGLGNNVPNDTLVRADARRLEQMLTNLIDNAVKFNREGGSVAVDFREETGRHFISVIDEGEGIPPDHLDRIFERFYRADRSRTSGIGGTGLGLAIVKHLAKLHGGEISATSTLGVGSRFTIELPA
jgi:two-component system, OmpR family, phosphate regulon sensor histidine kinase PhoR